MGIISFIKKHRLYKYVKENNSLLIFFFTIFGTAVTFVFRGFGYLYYYAKYKTLQVPVSLITDKVSAVSITITVIEIILATLSLLMGMLFVASFTELKKDKKKFKKSHYFIKWFATLIITFFVITPINFAFMVLQGLEIGLARQIIGCVLITCLELGMIKTSETDIFGDERKLSMSTALFAFVFLVCVMVVTIYWFGNESATSNTNTQQVLYIESTEYVVLETFEDKYVIAECKEQDNKLTIHTDKQKVINLENVEYENKKFNSIELEGNK